MADDAEAKLREFFDAAHAPGALDGKTKELLHIAVLLALRCEPLAVQHFGVAKTMGISDEELAETVQLAASVSAAVVVATAKRAKRTVDAEAKWWGGREGEA